MGHLPSSRNIKRIISLDGRRKYAVSVSSVDEALETVANFEKYLLPEMARPAIQATPVPRMRLR